MMFDTILIAASLVLAKPEILAGGLECLLRLMFAFAARPENRGPPSARRARKRTVRHRTQARRRPVLRRRRRK